MDAKVCAKGQMLVKGRCIRSNELFKSIKAKYGYKELKDMGFFAYKSDGWGDWHRSNRIPGIAVTGAYDGYVINEKTSRGYFAIGDYELGGYRNKIRKGDTETLKRRILEVTKGR